MAESSLTDAQAASLPAVTDTSDERTRPLGGRSSPSSQPTPTIAPTTDRSGQGRGQGQGWIVGPRFDALVFFASAAVTLVPYLLVDRLRVSSYVVLAGVAVLANGPHLASTWTRVYLDGRERFRRPVHYYLVPAVLAAVVLAFILVDGEGSTWPRTAVFYWASYHFTAQCYGLLRIYQRKHGVLGTLTATVEKVLLYAGCFYCVLRRLYTGPWSLFNVAIWHPYPSAAFVNACGAAVLTLAAYYLVRLFTERRSDGASGRGDGNAPRLADPRRPLFIAASIGAFAVPFILIHDGTAAFAAAAAWHAIQYLGIVWYYNRNRFRDGVDPEARLVSYVSQPGRTALYLVTLLAIVGVFYGGLLVVSRYTADRGFGFGALSLLVWTSLTFGHYYLDGVIWKLRKDPALVARLNV